MKRLIILVLFAISALAQTLTVTGPASVMAGSTATITVSLSGSAGSNLSAVEWTASLPTGWAVGAPAISQAAAAAGLAAYCGPSACLLATSFAGSTLPTAPAVMADGALATVPISTAAGAAPGTVSIPIIALLGASTAAAPVSIASGAMYTIRVLSRCDVNGDGVVNASDVSQIVNAIIGGGSCPVSGGCNLQTLISVMLAAMGHSCTL